MYGYSGVKGVNAQLAACPRRPARRWSPRPGSARATPFSGHGAPCLIGDAISAARAASAAGQLLVRADSGYYRQDVIVAAVAAKASLPFRPLTRTHWAPPNVSSLPLSTRRSTCKVWRHPRPSCRPPRVLAVPSCIAALAGKEARARTNRTLLPDARVVGAEPVTSVDVAILHQ